MAVRPAKPAGRTLSEITRFLTAGIGANLFALGIYYSLTTWPGIPYTPALVMASGMALVASYVANKRWTFSDPSKGSLPRFLAIYASSLAAQIVILNVAVQTFGIRHEVAVVIGLAAATTASFLLQRHWVFRGHMTTPNA